MSTNNQDLQSIELRLAALEKEKALLLTRKKALISNHSTLQTPENLSTQQKIEIFASLFKGRDDIYALRWDNKQGRSGYSVACSNEWQPGLCNKPKIKCGECPNKAFKAIGNEAFYEHLSGKKTIGIYPLLNNDHSWFVAVDFDKSDWKIAVSAFRKACNSWDIPCAVERSRSGNGAHIWIFFTHSMPAKDVRRLGFALLDKAMEYHAGLSFESYDRLFPNQDNLPDGGFGNLIALPLQYTSRKSGNSEFIDEDFAAYPDQWAFLASSKRVTAQKVHECLGSITNTVNNNEPELKPWEKGIAIANSSIKGCPESVTIVLANKIYIPVDHLPQILLARLKRIASFSNPVFFKTQALRFSTVGIPRFICLAHIEQGYLSLPRGCFDNITALLNQQSISIKIDDKRKTGQKLKGLVFKGELRKEQKKAVNKLAKHDMGVLHAPTAFGKTVVAIGLIHKRKVNTLILVHSRQLLNQWKERLEMFLDAFEIGVIGGGKRKPSGKIDIATYQSMINRSDNSVDPCLHSYGQIIVDECHHISAPKYEMLLSEVHAKYIVGVTATPQRQDGHQPIVFMLAGPIRHNVKLDNRHQFDQRVIVRKLEYSPPLELMQSENRPHIAQIYSWLMNNPLRNKAIINDVLAELEKQRNPLVLTERREHAVMLGELLSNQGINHQILRGAMKAKEYKAAMAALEDTQVLIATGKYLGEGFDLPKLDTLFLALPISWKGSLAQYAGRIHRQAEGKDRVLIYDYVDVSLPTLQRMYQRRSKGYDAMGYVINEERVQGDLILNN